MIMSSNRYCFYSQADAKETRTIVFRTEKEMELFLPEVIQITHQNVKLLSTLENIIYSHV